ncbi:MAG: hypothetical protein ACLRTD_24555 [Bacteroides sp.]
MIRKILLPYLNTSIITQPSATGYMWNKYIDYSVYAKVRVDCTNDIIVFRWRGCY